MDSLPVSAGDIKLAYIDSGPPPSADVYTTVFALHGTQVCNAIYRKLLTDATKNGFRLVAINRRGYPGSTLYNKEESTVQMSLKASDEDRAAFIHDRGHEIITFIIAFIEQQRLPAIAEGGGVAVLGWSLGVATALAAVASVQDLAADAQQKIGQYLRCLILHDPPPAAIGLQPPPSAWCPLWDESIPATKRVPLFIQWAGSYFAHGDLHKKDRENLSYVVPSTLRTPTIFTMTPKEQSDTVAMSQATFSDVVFPLFNQKQAADTYRNACLNAQLKAKLPGLKIWGLMGDETAWLFIISIWKLEQDNAVDGVKVVKGGNHFMHWDNHEGTAVALRELITEGPSSG